jgi:hypothetical protein
MSAARIAVSPASQGAHVRTRVTIEYLEPTLEGAVLDPIVLEFDSFEIHQSRPVHYEYDYTGRVTNITPDQTTTTVITGTRTVPVE